MSAGLPQAADAVDHRRGRGVPGRRDQVRDEGSAQAPRRGRTSPKARAAAGGRRSRRARRRRRRSPRRWRRPIRSGRRCSRTSKISPSLSAGLATTVRKSARGHPGRGDGPRGRRCRRTRRRTSGWRCSRPAGRTRRSRRWAIASARRAPRSGRQDLAPRVQPRAGRRLGRDRRRRRDVRRDVPGLLRAQGAEGAQEGLARRAARRVHHARHRSTRSSSARPPAAKGSGSSTSSRARTSWSRISTICTHLGCIPNWLAGRPEVQVPVPRLGVLHRPASTSKARRRGRWSASRSRRTPTGSSSSTRARCSARNWASGRTRRASCRSCRRGLRVAIANCE